jgi:aminoglycoside phosphotransferase (APT) family kinase protein
MHYCDDASVIGTSFYCMQFVEGRIFRDPSLASLPAMERTEVYRALVKVLR